MEFERLRKEQFRGGSFWQRGYLAVSSGSITDELIQDYINNQGGESFEE